MVSEQKLPIQERKKGTDSMWENVKGSIRTLLSDHLSDKDNLDFVPSKNSSSRLIENAIFI